jgi:hypothetical protein
MHPHAPVILPATFENQLSLDIPPFYNIMKVTPFRAKDSFKIIIQISVRTGALGAPMVLLNNELNMDSSIRMTTCFRNWLC